MTKRLKISSVRVVERETGSFALGRRLHTEDGVHFSGQLAQRNFNGDGEDLMLNADGFIKHADRILDAGHARINYRIPRFLESSGDFFVEGFAQYSINLLPQFDYDREGAGIGYRLPFMKHLTAHFGLRGFNENVFGVEEDVTIGEHDVGTTFYSIFRSQLTLDYRDDVFNPRSGFQSILQTELSEKTLGSEADFINLNLQTSIYAPVFPILIWANNARFRYLQPIDGTDVVPLSQRIFLGGRDSLRGFSRY